MVAAIREGFGRHNYYVTVEGSAGIFRYVFYDEILGSWASCLARVSVALMLLEFHISIPWRVFLWIAILFQLGVAFSSNLCLFIQCRSLRAMWDMVPDATCWTSQQTQIYAYTFAGKCWKKSPGSYNPKY
jgi:hypothetical protein